MSRVSGFGRRREGLGSLVVSFHSQLDTTYNHQESLNVAFATVYMLGICLWGIVLSSLMEEYLANCGQHHPEVKGTIED